MTALGIAAGVLVIQKERAAAVPSGLPTLFRAIREGEECTANTGFASSCWFNGLRLTRTTNLSLSDGYARVAFHVTLPQSTRVAIVAEQGYYWSAQRKAWMPFTLAGQPYGERSGWLNQRGYANLSIPQNDLASGVNYIVTWDVLYQDRITGWTGPSCVSKSRAIGTEICWRLTTFYLEQ